MNLKNLNANKVPKRLKKKLNNKKIVLLFKLFEKDFDIKENFIVAVSGGPDSIALVYLLNKWIKLNKGRLFAIIFDHRMRKNSEVEAYHVKEILKDLNIETCIIKAKRNKLLKKIWLMQDLTDLKV